MTWLALAVVAGALDEIVWGLVYAARLTYRYDRYCRRIQLRALMPAFEALADNLHRDRNG